MRTNPAYDEDLEACHRDREVQEVRPPVPDLLARLQESLRAARHDDRDDLEPAGVQLTIEDAE